MKLRRLGGFYNSWRFDIVGIHLVMSDMGVEPHQQIIPLQKDPKCFLNAYCEHCDEGTSKILNFI